jgi:hypothetical protein
MSTPVDLTAIRTTLTAQSERMLATAPWDFYTLADWAILRTVMGDDLLRLPDAQRRSWLGLMQNQQDPDDGSFPTFQGHTRLHANGTAVGGIGALGGRFRHPVRLYRPFAAAEQVPSWLETAVDWSRTWGESHRFWGGMHCFACLPTATRAWKDAVFAWLDREADPATGWWRRGTPHVDRHQGLGGAVHILPIYQHLGRRFPLIERALDSTLALQLPAGHWYESRTHGATYLDLDALYVFALGRRWAPQYRPTEIAAAVARHADLIVGQLDGLLRDRQGRHAHFLLELVGILGRHRQLDPERFRDDRPWSDIFSDRALYRDTDPAIASAPAPDGVAR